jgi:hypothetical protein
MTDIAAWRRVVEQTVSGVADEELQRRSWFGNGPEIFSPEEAFNQVLDDAALEEFLLLDSNGLTDLQRVSGKRFLKLVEDLSAQTPQFIDPAKLIDDPRWKLVRKSAAHFLAVLRANTKPAPEGAVRKAQS